MVLIKTSHVSGTSLDRMFTKANALSLICILHLFGIHSGGQTDSMALLYWRQLPPLYAVLTNTFTLRSTAIPYTFTLRSIPYTLYLTGGCSPASNTGQLGQKRRQEW